MGIFLVVAVASAWPAEAARTVSPADWAAIEHGLALIRQCQMENGMIRAKGAGDPVWTVPYLGNFAALALLAADEVRPNATDVRRVERWLLWYAANQKADGTIDDQEGTVASYRSRGRRDSTDSYAATFLMAVARYERALDQKPEPSLHQAAQKALSAIEAVVQPDGLTIAKPDYPMKYLMDNIEVFGGLDEAASYFDAVGDGARAARARRRAARLATSLEPFWSETNHSYAVALDMKGAYTVGLAKSYPDGLAQLFALAHMPPPRRDLWRTLRGASGPATRGCPSSAG